MVKSCRGRSRIPFSQDERLEIGPKYCLALLGRQDLSGKISDREFSISLLRSLTAKFGREVWGRELTAKAS